MFKLGFEPKLVTQVPALPLSNHVTLDHQSPSLGLRLLDDEWVTFNPLYLKPLNL